MGTSINVDEYKQDHLDNMLDEMAREMGMQRAAEKPEAVKEILDHAKEVK